MGEGHSVGLLFTHFSRVLQCTPVCLYWLLNWNVQKNATLDLHLSSKLTTRKHNAASGKIGQTFLLCACSELKFSVPSPSWECPSPRTAQPGGPRWGRAASVLIWRVGAGAVKLQVKVQIYNEVVTVRTLNSFYLLPLSDCLTPLWSLHM